MAGRYIYLTVLLGIASLAPLARAQEAVTPCGPQADPSGLIAALEAIGDPAAQDAAEALRLLVERAKLACQEREFQEAEIAALRQALAARGRLLEIARETVTAYEDHFAEVDRILPQLTGKRWGCTVGPGGGWNVTATSGENSGVLIVGVVCGWHL